MFPMFFMLIHYQAIFLGEYLVLRFIGFDVVVCGVLGGVLPGKFG